jgi:HPt (histidine-containing phosphotransfer) domain-containing protein
VHKAPKLQSDLVDSSLSCAALNEDHLHRSTFGDAALRLEILGLFRSHLSAFRNSLLLPADAANWRYMTHSLKGAAAAIGAEELAALATNWEAQPAPETNDGRQAALQTFDEALAAFNSAVRNLQT